MSAKKKKGKARERKEKSLKPYYISLIVAGVVIVLSIIMLIFSNSISDGISKLMAGSDYVYAKYGEGKLPSDFVDILNNAEEDEKANLENYDTYLTIGDRKFSQPTVTMLYIDEYDNHLDTAKNDAYYYGYSTENFSFDDDPSEVAYSDDETWGEYLYNEAAEDFAQDLYLFSEALSEGFIMDDSYVKSLMDEFETVDAYDDPDAIAVNTYGEGVTANIFKAHQIISVFTDAYESSKTDEIEKDVSADEIADLVSGNEQNFETFRGRIYPITGGTEGYESIKTEDEFLAFAAKDYAATEDADEDYDADTATDMDLTLYGYVANLYGPTVASYVFSSDRKAGEISYIDNGTYVFLVYIEKPVYYEATVTCTMYYELSYSSDDVDTDDTAFRMVYNNWVNNGAEKKDLLDLCDKVDYSTLTIPGGEMESKIADFSAEIDRWLREPGRKEGDHEIFLLDSIRAIVYYEKTNASGSDKDARASEIIAKNRFSEDYTYENNDAFTITLADEDMMDEFFSGTADPIQACLATLYS